MLNCRAITRAAIWIAAASGAVLAEPGLSDDLKTLTYFQGSWSCEGKFVQNNAPISADMTFAPELNGAWLAHRHDDRPPYPFHALDMWGYDKAAKQFVSMLHDSGGGVRMFTSPGWEGSKLVWTGDALSKSSQRFIFERTNEHQFAMSYEVRSAAGAWMPVDTTTCARK